MANFKCLTMFWMVIILVNLLIISFKEVKAQNLAIGQRCKRDNQCNSGNCCGGLGIWKRCWECCKNNDCPAGQKCKKKQCVATNSNSGSSSGNGNLSSGDKCSSDDDCSTGLRCCGLIKKCWECCRNGHCLANEKCKNKQCVQNTPFSGIPGSGNPGGLGESCANGCSGDLNCCGIFPFRRCWPCCNDSHCDWQNGEECKKRFCI